MGKTIKSVFIIAVLFLVIFGAVKEIEAQEPGCAVDSGGNPGRLCAAADPTPRCDRYCRVYKRAVGGGRCVGHITENLRCICFMCIRTNPSDRNTL